MLNAVFVYFLLHVSKLFKGLYGAVLIDVKLSDPKKVKKFYIQENEHSCTLGLKDMGFPPSGEIEEDFFSPFLRLAVKWQVRQKTRSWRRRHQTGRFLFARLPTRLSPPTQLTEKKKT